MERFPPELIGRALQNPEFRRQLLSDPEAAVAGTGFVLEPDQIEALKQMDPAAIDEAIEALVGDVDSTKYG